MLRYINSPLEMIGIFLAFVIALTVHEFAHAYVSDRLGDPTARLMGRLSLNPIVHLDLLGTLMLLFAPFGWAKPVSVDPYNFRNPRRDTALVSLAGPAANIMLAVVLSVAYALILQTGGLYINILTVLLTTYLRLIIILNVNLAVFNLIPIHPLDGFAIVRGFLSDEYARQWQELESYGMLFLMFLVFPIFGSVAPIRQIMDPVTSFILAILLPSAPLI